MVHLQEGLSIEGRLAPPPQGFGSSPPNLGIEAPFVRMTIPVAPDGAFELTGLPEGLHQLFVLHPRRRGHNLLGAPVAAGTRGVVREYPE